MSEEIRNGDGDEEDMQANISEVGNGRNLREREGALILVAAGDSKCELGFALGVRRIELEVGERERKGVCGCAARGG